MLKSLIFTDENRDYNSVLRSDSVDETIFSSGLSAVRIQFVLERIGDDEKMTLNLTECLKKMVEIQMSISGAEIRRKHGTGSPSARSTAFAF